MNSTFSKLDTAHLSVRVPWHDDGWRGTVCCNPAANVACLALANIRENRDDAAEERLAGREWADLKPEELPACRRERANFMAPRAATVEITHPYVGGNASHAHFKTTPIPLPPYSAPCVPFRWLLRSSAEEIAAELGLPFQVEAEARIDGLLGWETSWVQDRDNQWSLLKSFLSAFEPDRSLCFFYAKEVPLIEDSRRVLVGVGRIRKADDPREYDYSQDGPVRSLIWECNVHHSIREDLEDGVVLPYQDILALSEDDATVDPADYVALVPDDHRGPFSYGSEHVGNDSAIAALLEIHSALERAAKVLPNRSFGPQLAWLDERLAEVWTMRGPCPGLATALHAFGVEHPALLLRRLAPLLGDNEDPWPLMDRVLRDPSDLDRSLVVHAGVVLRRVWKKLGDERRALLKLLSRFDLTFEQAARFYAPERRANAGIEATDAELLANPYLIYELDRSSVDPVSAGTIDRGALPTDAVRERHPLPEPSRLDERIDPRRVRALIVAELERAAAEDGNTLLPQDQVVTGIYGQALDPPCPLDSDLLEAIREDLTPFVVTVSTADDRPALQLERLAKAGQRIRDVVRQRVKGLALDVQEDWRKELDSRFGPLPTDPDERVAEDRARAEKAAALRTLATARVSALVGPAGTGKTELLARLCGVAQIRDRGVLLLAPTGKARVQLETRIGASSDGIAAKTIAQFLVRTGRYLPDTGSYVQSDAAREDGFRTVIIDESSMLTEEMLAALLDGLKGVERLIFVGDHRQLPPIGSGRPFVDIVAELATPASASAFPRVGPNYAELTVVRRFIQGEGETAHQDEELTDVLLAEWFSGQTPSPGADEIWARLGTGSVSSRLEVRSWETPEELRGLLLDVLVSELNLTGANDVDGFERSIGGEPGTTSPQIFFWRGAAERIEDWQILSPVRGGAHGVTGLNRYVQRHFRDATRSRAMAFPRKVPKPCGPEEILYGDKVINVRNASRRDFYPKKEGTLEYVANGEIGVVVGQYKSKNMTKLPWKLEVEFSSQKEISYGFRLGEFDGEAGAGPPLELAYAVTVHKAQGSEFKKTILVIPNPCRNLSRELLYTALTRQRERVILLYQGNPSDLRNYADPSRSETARRLTNLFAAPKVVEVGQKYLEDRLIHRTRRGDAVRSKSEVIIADLLFSKKIEYEYELPLYAPDGSWRLPDFTVSDAETGREYFWEHLGLLHDPKYRARWEKKRNWYEAQGIRPRGDDPDAPRQLVVTSDDAMGGIASSDIDALATELFG